MWQIYTEYNVVQIHTQDAQLYTILYNSNVRKITIKLKVVNQVIWLQQDDYPVTGQ